MPIKIKKMSVVKPEDVEVKQLYNRFQRFSMDALFGRATENSIYRKKAIASPKLTTNSTVLDGACGVGFNFKIIESYLKNSGKLAGIDISFESLKFAKRRNSCIKEI
ncbi:MAG: hypothetical protein ACTSUQ_13720 [Candidatus Freyarchaeota archaeon]